MTKMKMYRVTLEPLDWFFFGGESTFDNSVKTSYIAHSNKFPQQTALLGMLRYQLLKQDHLLTVNDMKRPNLDDVKERIGEGSFDMDNNGQTFGYIRGLSPVFIEKNGDVDLFSVPLSYSYDLSFETGVEVYLNGKKKNTLISDLNSAGENTFNPKIFNNYMKLYCKNGDTEMLENIFETKMQVGITKNTDFENDKDRDENRFFKHEMVRFLRSDCNRFRFAFYVELSNGYLKDDFVFLGAERSCFKMQVSELTDTSGAKKIFMNNHPCKSEKGRIVLLSSTYVNDLEKLNVLCKFHWSFSVPFRNIIQAKDGSGHLKSGVISYHRRDICYNMFCMGTVLFFDEKDRKEIEGLLDNAHLQDIGYNYFDSMIK